MDFDDADKTWSILARQVEMFIEDWERQEAVPRLSDYVPEGPPELRRMALVELAKVDLEYRWQHRQTPKRIEDYVAEFPELADEGGPPSDLIYEEYHVRAAAGESLDPADYCKRFAEQADQLRKLIPQTSPTQSTALFATQRPEAVKVGDRLDDFDLLAVLGRGAFASVFLARQNSMQRLVALKVSADRGTEPQTLARLDHPHIVRVFDQRTISDRQLRLLYMQYVPGGTLQDVIQRLREVPIERWRGNLLLEMVDASLARRGETPPGDPTMRRRFFEADWPQTVCLIGAQLASALDYADRQGVLHRDVKPANVLMAADGTPKLADFNVSFSSQMEGATPAAYFGGSLAYMSPEQLDVFNPSRPGQPEHLDARSDLYALGVVLWELLYGKRPFCDEQVHASWTATLAEMVARRRAEPPHADLIGPPSAVHGRLHAVLARCLEPYPSRRWTDGGELMRELTLCLQPRARQLLRPSRSTWSSLARRVPILMLMIAVLVPNALAAVFNYYYNWEEIVRRIPDAAKAFWRTQTTINSIAFPVGLAICVYAAWPVARSLAKVRRGHDSDARLLSLGRTRALQIGQIAAIVGLVEWLLAGIAYPVTLRVLVGDVSPWGYLHFFTSLSLCGLVAAAYPFFLVTILSIRAFYPPLLNLDESSTADEPRLARLSRICGSYLLVAGGVPMLATVLLALSGSQNRLALGIMSAAGLIGFAAAYGIYRILQSDIEGLLIAIRTCSGPLPDEGPTFSS